MLWKSIIIEGPRLVDLNYNWEIKHRGLQQFVYLIVQEKYQLL